MKTSKKLLSLFLAVVMVVTSCSVGFTAFAADGNKTDKNNAYWNNNTEADEAFDAVTALINNYVPVLANGPLKSVLEGVGMDVNENTSLQDIVAGVSPALMKLLGGASGNKEEIITDYYKAHGYSSSDSEGMYKEYSSIGLYDYLDDEDAAMSFYAIYQFCKNNINSDDAKKKDFAAKNLPKLEALLGKHLEAYDKLFSEDGGNEVDGTARLKEYKNTVEDGGITFNSDLTLYELENFEIGGVNLKDVHKTDKKCNTKIAYDNMYLDFEGAPFQIDNIAKALFYQYNDKYVMGIFYLYLANLGGATIKYNGKTLTPSNYKTVIGDADKTYAEYIAGRELEDNDKSKAIYDSYCEAYRLNEVYKTIFDGSTVASKITGTGEFGSPYYNYICIGALEITKSYDTEKYSNAADFVKAQNVTDDQIKALYNYVKGGGKFDDYLDDANCAFNEYIKKFYSNWLRGSYVSQMIDYNLEKCANEAAAVSLMKNFKFSNEYEETHDFYKSDGDKILIRYFDAVYPSDNATPFSEITTFMLPSVIVLQEQGGSARFGFPGTANIRYYYRDKNTGKLVKNLIGDAKYEYDNYKIPDKLAVEVVNASINNFVDYLKPGSDYYPIIDSILSKLLVSDIDLHSTLYDIWKNLYEHPIETVFNLLPVLVVLVDEVLVPMVFNDKGPEESDLYSILITGLFGEGGGIEAIKKLSQASGDTSVGIGNLAFDLNKVIPSILNWLLGNDDAAKAIVGTYADNIYAEGVDPSVPVFTNIYAADKALAGARLNGGLAKVLKNGALSGNPAVAEAIDEAVTEIASFALDAVNEYLDAHGDDTRHNVDGDPIQKGLNNIFVALPELLDIMGKNYIDKYNIDSNWTLSYKIKTVSGDKHNTVLDGFKALATQNDASKVLEYFVNTLIGEWLNPIIDIVNDTIKDDKNKITSNLSLVQSLLDAIGGLGEKSIITDVLNGLFQLKRNDDATFTLKERDNGFVGFSAESGMFLLSNILYKDSSGNAKGLIPFITTLIKQDQGSAKYKVTNIYKSNGPLLAGSSKSKKSSVGTNYSELLSKDNLKAAKKLVDSLDTLLASLLENTSLNGFDLDKTDNILFSVATVASSYFGAKNTNDLVKLINNYFYYIVGETNKKPGTFGKIGISPKKGDVDKSKVYTSANLSNLVIQTYSLIENIIDYLFYNKDSGFLKNMDPNMLIADAAYGLVSPDAVAVRLSKKYSKAKNILLENSRKNWNSFKVEINAVNRDNGTYYTKDYLKFGFSKGNKKAFYNALGESLSGVAGIIGAVLTASYTDASKKDNYYSKLVYPLFNTINTALGAKGVMSPADFNKASAASKLIDGIIAPVSGALDTLYDAPATFILNFVKGVSGILDDASIKSLVASATDPINFLIQGAAKVVYNLSPTLAAILSSVKLDLSGLLPEKNIVVSLLNNISFIKKLATIPEINWKKLASAKTPEEVLLLVYGFVVDFLLSNEKLQKIINSLSPDITKILKKLSASEILRLVTEVISVVQSPTEIYWTFREYANKLAKNFSYPRGVLPSEASNAVGQLDDLVENVFPLLNALGVTDIKGLYPLINDKLYTNEILTTIAKALYGALSKGTVATVLSAVSLDVSPKGYAKFLTDKSYGKTYSSAAATLKKYKSWDKVKTINWGFTNGSSKAQTGFVNGLAAVLRPLNNVLAVLLAEGKLDSSKLNIRGLIKTLSVKGSTNYAEDSEYGGTITYKLKDGIFVLTVRSNAITDSGKRTATNVLKVNVEDIVKDFENLFGDANFGTNGYESAVIPILEAFMCKNIKTYKQYKSDYKKAKDNLLIDVLNPVLGLVKDIANNPFDTVTKILPNVAYFIDNNGLSQAVGNLLAPITAKNGVLGVLKKNGIDVDKLIKSLTGKSLGKIVTDALKIKNVKLNLELNNLAASNVQDIVIPLVNKLLKDKLGLTLPKFTFKAIASHGTIKVVSSKAKNSQGKYTTRQVKARQGEVLVAVLRYVSDVLIKNAKPIKKLITNIDAIKKNDTLKNIISSVFNQMATAAKDDIVRAVFYFLTERSTDSFFDYRNFKYKDGYKFTFGNMDEDFCRQLAPMLDGLVGGLLEGGLGGLVEEKLYTDNLIAKLATGLYGAVEGVKINDNIGSLTNLLAMTDIDFSASNVASLLTNEKYGLTYPAAADVIRNAGSWKNVKAEDLKFGVKDRNSFLNALVAVLRPIYGVLDVLLNDASLNLFDLVKVPGSDGYSSTIVPLLEAFGVYNIKTQYQYREDTYKAYDNILLDIINPLWDKVEDILNAPVEMLADILPNLSLFFANDGLLQIVDNLFTPISALLEAIKPIADINAILKAAGLDVPKLLNEKVGLNVPKFDLYDLPGTLKPLVGADNVVDTLNSVLSKIKIKGTPLGIVLPEIDWFKLASHGKFIPNATSQAATYGGRIAVKADQDETLIAVLRFLIDTINYKDNYDAIVKLISGLLGDNVSASISDVISQVLGMLKGDSDEVIEQLVDLLKQFA
ncbi:MAG: hypothetical protein IJR70_09230 [Eubacterium sp.]|nr:hypothetical protein [Eubacterium sp.]